MRQIIPGRLRPIKARQRAGRPATRGSTADRRSVLDRLLVTLAGCGSAVRKPAVESEDKGFFGWHFHAPFDTSEVKTVAVFIKSQSFRRDLQQQLTEAVIKEINLRTPYRVVGTAREGRFAAHRSHHAATARTWSSKPRPTSPASSTRRSPSR